MKNLGDKDLNLLNVFAVLMEEKNVSKAAKRLFLSQSSVSHALARLRTMFDDRLLVRVSKGMEATPKAEELLPKVKNFIRSAEEVFFRQDSFHLALTERTVHISSTDYAEKLILPDLLGIMKKACPMVQVKCSDVLGSLPKLAMERGEVDLAIAGFFGDLPDGFYKQRIFKDQFAVLSRRGHAIEEQSFTLDSYLKHEHILVSPQGDFKSLIDRQIHPRKRKVIAGISNFSSPGWVVAQTDLLLTAPSRLLDKFCEYLPVVKHELPLTNPEIAVQQVWHERLQDDPFHQWLRKTIRDLFRDLEVASS